MDKQQLLRIAKNILTRKREEQPRPLIDDDLTTDRSLKALRRHRRVQLEEQEKIMLRKRITEYNRKRDGYLLNSRNGLIDSKVATTKKPLRANHLQKGGIL